MKKNVSSKKFIGAELVRWRKKQFVVKYKKYFPRDTFGPRDKKKTMRSYQLGVVIGLTQGCISDIERGLSYPSATTIALIAINTKIDIVKLLTGVKQ